MERKEWEKTSGAALAFRSDEEVQDAVRKVLLQEQEEATLQITRAGADKPVNDKEDKRKREQVQVE